MSRFIQTIALSILVMLLPLYGVAAESMQLVVNGQTRTVLLERPAAQGPLPTVIMVHGAGGNAARESQNSGLGQLGPQNGFVAVFPEGRGGRWNHLPPGKESDQFVRVFQQFGGTPDDVTYFRMMVADLVRRGISDPKRIYLVGQSAGGIMALRIACADAGLFAAIGVLIASMPDPTGVECRPAKPLPVLMPNGTADKLVPFGGGPVGTPDGRGPGVFSVWSTERLMTFFRQLNGCSEPVQQSVWPGQGPEKIQIVSSTKCAGGPVISYRVVGGGHDPRPQALNVSQLLLDFFRDKVR